MPPDEKVGIFFPTYGLYYMYVYELAVHEGSGEGGADRKFVYRWNSIEKKKDLSNIRLEQFPYKKFRNSLFLS